ncbi:hypothetical protein [Streptomyces fructofermentans]|uniref:Uncharacterized protein n=1 Tax=Streptomyces fructofermentans TaxID=152141 RepID=A0A918NTQ1_9ACTN|nr:hypothetical protein [Streptomyces fructofermentans]GGX93825.1 hypothetical protein GCM10010515_70810 [Streptomyces fructofermentans]
MPDPTTLPDPFETAAQAFGALLDALGPGHHHLLCSAYTPLGSFASASTTIECTPDQDHVDADYEGWLMFCHLLAQTSIAFRGATIFTRTYTTTSTSVLRGWSVTNGWPHPMTANDVYTAYCIDPATGEPTPPEPDTDYQAGTPLTTASGGTRH